MLVIAQHTIHNPEAFWSAAKNVTENLPTAIKLHAVYPSEDLKTGVCLWEAHTTEEVQKFLDDNVGSLAKNICYKINISEAVGLPRVKENFQFIN